MSGFLKKLRSRSKNSEEQDVSQNVSEVVSSSSVVKEYSVRIFMIYISSSYHCKAPPNAAIQEEPSPERHPVTLSGSLFSGMTLTKAATKHEDESSPYLTKREFSKFLFGCYASIYNWLTEEVENVEDSLGSGFSFINSRSC